MRHQTAKLGWWSLWALAAAVPLGCAAFLVTQWRRRPDDFETWWSHRERARTNGHDLPPARGRARRDDLFV